MTWNVQRLRMLDTGIGKAAGYENDDALRAAAKAERDALSPEVRAVVEEAEADFMHRVLFGNDAVPPKR